MKSLWKCVVPHSSFIAAVRTFLELVTLARACVFVNVKDTYEQLTRVCNHMGSYKSIHNALKKMVLTMAALKDLFKVSKR